MGGRIGLGLTSSQNESPVCALGPPRPRFLARRPRQGPSSLTGSLAVTELCARDLRSHGSARNGRWLPSCERGPKNDNAAQVYPLARETPEPAKGLGGRPLVLPPLPGKARGKTSGRRVRPVLLRGPRAAGRGGGARRDAGPRLPASGTQPCREPAHGGADSKHPGSARRPGEGTSNVHPFNQ